MFFSFFKFEEDMKETIKKRLNFVLLPVVHTFCYHVNSELVTTTEIKQLDV